MENLIRILSAFLFIGLIVIVIVFFSILGTVPSGKMNSVFKKNDEVIPVNEDKPIIELTTTTTENISGEEEKQPNEQQKFGSFSEQHDKTLFLENGKFAPATIIAKKGDEVKIGIVSKDREYQILIPDYGLSQTVGPNDNNKLIAFQASNAGDFLIVCKGCENDFQGKLIISN